MTGIEIAVSEAALRVLIALAARTSLASDTCQPVEMIHRREDGQWCAHFRDGTSAVAGPYRKGAG